MTDYLELLLERRREEEEEQDVPRLDAEEAFPRKWGREKPKGGSGSSGRSRRASLETRPASLETRPDMREVSGMGAPAAAVLTETAGAWAAPRRESAGAVLEQALGRAVDAMDTAGRGAARGTAGLSGLPGRAPEPAPGGAAGLAVRLSQAALASAAPAVRAVFDTVEEAPSPGTDWEEFDRRLERDARRYDGGLGMY